MEGDPGTGLGVLLSSSPRREGPIIVGATTTPTKVSSGSFGFRLRDKETEGLVSSPSIVSVYSPKKATPTKITTKTASPLRTVVAKELKQAKHESNKARRQRAKAQNNDSLKKKLFDEKIFSSGDLPPPSPKKGRTKTLQSSSRNQRATSPARKPGSRVMITSSQVKAPHASAQQGPQLSPDHLKPTVIGGEGKEGPQTQTSMSMEEIANLYLPSKDDVLSPVGSYTPSVEEKNDNTFTFVEVNYTSELEKWRFDLLKDEQEMTEEGYNKQVNKDKVSSWKAETKAFEEEVVAKMKSFQHTFIRGVPEQFGGFTKVPPKFWEDIEDVRDLRNKMEKGTNLSRCYSNLGKKLERSPALNNELDVTIENEYDVVSHKSQAQVSYPHKFDGLRRTQSHSQLVSISVEEPRKTLESEERKGKLPYLISEPTKISAPRSRRHSFSSSLSPVMKSQLLARLSAGESADASEDAGDSEEFLSFTSSSEDEESF
eukprot:TRINITY_DN10264_c0_g1_i1.p1 TRINITY_DN10264_c0_g1~~TRINITY_DN10264_c0_g1_i1.p1  ORF type:complete len:486 (-),score=106.94 TRINITY_DN10264_c0_g1_i1:40-1497(-)